MSGSYFGRLLLREESETPILTHYFIDWIICVDKISKHIVKSLSLKLLPYCIICKEFDKNALIAASTSLLESEKDIKGIV